MASNQNEQKKLNSVELQNNYQLSDIKIKKQAALFSLLLSFIVLFLKMMAYFKTGSSAILSDALETITNVVTAIVALIALKYALEPADENHPYGHGKLEYFSAAFEGGIILFAALTIIFESVRSFFYPKPITALALGVGYVTLATLINLGAGLYLHRLGQQKKSEVLKASGLHLLADVKTTVGVVIGLGLYYLTGLQWIDSLVGLLVGLWLGYESIQMIKRNIGGLLDETDYESLKELSACIQKNHLHGIVDIHNLRVIRSGSFHHIDAHLVVPEFWDIKKVHELSHEFEKQVVLQYAFEGEFAFHADPCYQNYCKICPIENCPVRIEHFHQKRDLSYEHMIKGPQYTRTSK